MFGLAILFLIVAIGSGLLGFGLIAGVAVAMAKIVFFIAIILFIISIVAHFFRRGA